MIAIAGGPRAGKTTSAWRMTAKPRGTDEALSNGLNSWSDASTAVSLWFNDPDIKVVEGVVVPRALRKWMKAHRRSPDKQPITTLIYLTHSWVELNKGQTIMAKGCWTVFMGILPKLVDRGVSIHILKKIPESFLDCFHGELGRL